MTTGVKLGLGVFTCALLLTACDKDKNYPETPFLEFTEYVELSGDSLRMVCYFRDGNGDIGSAIQNNQTGNFECPEEPDIQLGYQEMVNGEWEDREVDSDFCVLSLTPQGQDKTLEGDVQVNFPNPILLTSPNGDTVRYSMTLRDRSGNVSNTVWGPMVIND